ncbi:MAG: CdaR family protein [Eubacteriales bacterium]|nr:CdaR family protein [Eubacteriales bacterium]MDD3881034.1 CdaR family protein [Eubacteriales bacterium]MDD4511897.1 CdaR family protein [Eubacteriales bacterium]
MSTAVNKKKKARKSARQRADARGEARKTQNGAQPEKQREKLSVKEALHLFGKLLSHNWQWKICSLFVAVIIWSVLISQDPSMTREKTFNDVQLSVVGQDTLKTRGYVVVSNLDELPEIKLSADVPQLQYGAAAASTYYARVDLSRVTQAGAQSVPISYTNSSVYGAVSSVSPASVDVVVDEYVTRYRIPLSVRTEGELQDGYWADAASVDPSTINISGARSLISQVRSAKVTLDLSTLSVDEKEQSLALPIMLYDQSGMLIDSSDIRMTSDSLTLDSATVSVRIYELARIGVSGEVNITGEPAAGYRLASVNVVPETVLVAGDENAIILTKEIFSAAAVDISGRDRSFLATVPINVPDGAVYASTRRIVVSVVIEPIISTKLLKNIPLGVENVPDGLSANLQLRRCDLLVTGEQLWLDKLKAADFTLAADASGAGVGTLALPIKITYIGSDASGMKSAQAQPETADAVFTAE